MHRKITTALVTAIVLASSLGFGILMSADPASARAHRQHHASPAKANGAGTSDYARGRISNDVPFAPF